MILAQQLEDNEVKYIIVSSYESETFIPLLTTFYPNEKRVTALMKLGSLQSLGPSPYGECTLGRFDPVHCAANIRDYQMSRGSNIAKIKEISKVMEKEGHIFLFRDGKWHYFNKDKKYFRGNDFTAELPTTIPQPRANPLEGLEYRTLDSNSITSIYGSSFKEWSELENLSVESGKPIFVFRGNKLVTTINHPINNQ